jgi:hypothetical protein
MIVKTIKLEFDDETIEMTIEQALALKDELNKLFGREVQYIPSIPYVPYVPPTYPGIWYCNSIGGTVGLTWQSS